MPWKWPLTTLQTRRKEFEVMVQIGGNRILKNGINYKFSAPRTTQKYYVEAVQGHSGNV